MVAHRLLHPAALTLLAAACGGALLASSELLRAELGSAAQLLLAGDTAGLAAQLRSYGAAAAWVSAGLMVLQCIAAPLPAFPITMANGLVFGTVWGGLLALVSATAGAMICFFIARALGRGVVERLVPPAQLTKAEHFLERHGLEAIALARLMPVVPFDPISYLAGLSPMRGWRFFLATLLGQIPATLIYAHLGATAQERPGVAASAVLALAALAVVVSGIVRWRAQGSRAS